jgi:hypothetical protein
LFSLFANIHDFHIKLLCQILKEITLQVIYKAKGMESDLSNPENTRFFPFGLVLFVVNFSGFACFWTENQTTVAPACTRAIIPSIILFQEAVYGKKMGLLI